MVDIAIPIAQGGILKIAKGAFWLALVWMATGHTNMSLPQFQAGISESAADLAKSIAIGALPGEVGAGSPSGSATKQVLGVAQRFSETLNGSGNLETAYCIGDDCAISRIIGGVLDKQISPSVDPTMQGSLLSGPAPVPRPRPDRTG